MYKMKRIMNAKTLMAAALASIALASCTSDDFVGYDQPVVTEDSVAIDFGSNANAKTRATHDESARLLGNKFYVYGTKTTGAATTTLFDNYLVQYTAGTAGSTETNEKDWEYNGLISKKGATQGPKYWDFSAQHYDFVAASGLAGSELINNTTDGMRINVTDVAAMTNIYVADRVTATPTAQAATATTPATIAYKSVVELQFRRLGAQMRVGFYETVPGYAVKELIFYYIGAPSGSYEVGVGGAFPKSGKYTVTYDNATNAAKVKFVGADNVMDFQGNFGALDYTSSISQEGVAGKPYLAEDGSASATPINKFLGTNKTEATYGKGTYTIDGTAGVLSDYKPILPNENNSLKMQLRLDYTLVALDGSGDEIHVRDAYVYVPVEYLKWKPNYSYTYLFKISDNSNGYTGEGGGGGIGTGPGRDPDPDNGGGDNDPVIDPTTGEVIPPYIPDPSYPEIPDPDDPTKTIPDPDAPLIPNPAYPDGPGPDGDQHDPSNPVPTPTVPDPSDPGSEIEDPGNPAKLFPITFDAVVVDSEDNSTTVYTVVDGTNNSSETEH